MGKGLIKVMYQMDLIWERRKWGMRRLTVWVKRLENLEGSVKTAEEVTALGPWKHGNIGSNKRIRYLNLKLSKVKHL